MGQGGVTRHGDWIAAPGVQAVFGLLSDNGHQIFAVGGAVRDGLMGRCVRDVDFATDAAPDRVADLAKAAGMRVVPTGLDHGTVTLVVDGTGYEVTTFRRDVDTDGRRAVVAFARHPEEDARRRDFTMNALYADRHGTILDPVGGLPDLEARHVRFIGDAGARIAEDALRILRFYRFFAWYADPGSAPDAEGQAACAASHALIDGLSRERITAEMTRLLRAPDPLAALTAMEQAGVLARVLPGPPRIDNLSRLMAMERATGVAPGWHRRLSALSPNAPDAPRLRLSNADHKRLVAIATLVASPGFDAAEAAYHHGREPARDAALLCAADSGTAPPPDLEEQLERGAQARFPLSAADLMPPLEPGPELGQTLRRLEARWVASGFATSRRALLDEWDAD